MTTRSFSLDEGVSAASPDVSSRINLAVRLLFVGVLLVLFVWPTIERLIADPAESRTATEITVDAPEPLAFDGHGKWVGY